MLVKGRHCAVTVGVAVVATIAVTHVARSVRAADDEPQPTSGAVEGPRTYFQMRVGASSGNHTARPEVCAEMAPLRRFSVQACGTGAGIWHQDPAPQLAHFRVDWHILTRRFAGGVVEPLIGVGFAELQVGRDDPGFKFTGAGERAVETAGPEAATALRWIRRLDANFELVFDLHLGAAWLAHAPELVVPQSKLQVFTGVGAGVGF
jgi:hypothetical protein